MTKRNKKSKLKMLVMIVFIVTIFLAFGVMLLLFIRSVDRKPLLLEVSATDTVSLVWEFYACGNDCPYYRILAVENEKNEKYIGQMVGIQGVDVWEDHAKLGNIDGEQAKSGHFNIAQINKFVCKGNLKRYKKPLFWQCCMDSENLIFVADECRQVQLSEQEQCQRRRYVFKEINGRTVESLPEAAESGNAEAQYLLGELYQDGEACYPEDKAQALYWYEKSAEQGYNFARQILEEIRQEVQNEKKPDEVEK